MARQPPPYGGPGREEHHRGAGPAGTPSSPHPAPPPAPHRSGSAENTRPAGGSDPWRSRRRPPRRGQREARAAAPGLAHLLARQPQHPRRRRRHGRAARAPRRRVYLRPALGPAPRPPQAPPRSSPHRLIGVGGLGPAHSGVGGAFRLAPAPRPAWRHAQRGQPEGARGHRPQPHRPSGRRGNRAVFRPALLSRPTRGLGGITPAF